MSPEERQRAGGPTTRLETGIRLVSLLVAASILVLIANDPAIAGSRGGLIERGAGAAMLVGALTSAARGLGLRGRRHIRALTQPSVCWTLAGAGFLVQMLL